MKVLIVDDSSFFRKLLTGEFENSGYEIHEASNGQEALHFLASSAVDIIILDVTMPRMDGFATCSQIREKEYKAASDPTRFVPIVFLTARDTVKDRLRGFEAGATDFFSKQFHEGEFLIAVNKILKPKAAFRGVKALVVDDSPMACRIISAILEEFGVSVTSLLDGMQAWETVERSPHDFDMLVVDYAMPGLNGDEFCKRVRTKLGLKALPIIMVSGAVGKEYMLNSYKLGITDFVPKPFVKEEFIARLSVHLETLQLHRYLKANLVKLKELNMIKDNLLMICSHDLKSPLTSILGYSQLLQRNAQLPDNLKVMADRIKDAGEFLLHLINSLLDLGRFQLKEEEMEMSPVNLSEICQKSVKNMQGMADMKGVHLLFEDRTGGDAKISGNHLGLTRVCNNLISNAIKFTDRGKNVAVFIESDDSKISAVVQDQGIGISKEKVAEILQGIKHRSTKGTAGEEGTGLGLSIIQHIIRKHNGTFEVASEVGQGACFRIHFNKTD